MPEYVLDLGDSDGAKRFKALDAFTQGYVTAMFWTDGDQVDADEDGRNGGRVSFAELAPDSLARIIAECAEWQDANAALLQLAYDQDYSEERAGHDYWLTRNGHGAGFWCRDELNEAGSPDESLGDKLAEVSSGSRSIYRGDDGFVYYGEG